MDEVIEIEYGAKEWVGVQVTERDDGNVTATAVFQVFDADGDSVQAQASASITGSGTAKVYAEGLVDTTASDTASYAANGTYDVRFIITVGSALYYAHRHVKCVEKSL